LLVDRGLPECVTNPGVDLPLYYTGRMLRVAWNRVQSQYFMAANGVEQGGVLSQC